MEPDNGDPFEKGVFNPFAHPLVWCLQDVLHGIKSSVSCDNVYRMWLVTAPLVI